MMAVFAENISFLSHEIEHRGMIRVNGCRPLRRLDTFALWILGLTPQKTLCCRPLRGLGDSTI